jgi:glucose-6-phosphate 1-dehydrogenase
MNPEERNLPMNGATADALVFFGATGDLAYKKIFPALQGLVRRGHLDAPVIGVAMSGWNLEQLKGRARESLETHGGGVDPAAGEKLLRLLRYVDGDYNDPGTFKALRGELGTSKRPAFYLAIPPSMFEVVVDPLLAVATPVHEYAPGTWGPPEADALAPPGGWRVPKTSV